MSGPNFKCEYCGRKFVRDRYRDYRRHADDCAGIAQECLDSEWALKDFRARRRIQWVIGIIGVITATCISAFIYEWIVR